MLPPAMLAKHYSSASCGYPGCVAQFSTRYRAVGENSPLKQDRTKVYQVIFHCPLIHLRRVRLTSSRQDFRGVQVDRSVGVIVERVLGASALVGSDCTISYLAVNVSRNPAAQTLKIF